MNRFLAIDLGAESGRAMLGILDRGRSVWMGNTLCLGRNRGK